MKIDFEQIRELLAVVGTTEITELTIEAGEEKITVKKDKSPGSVVTEVKAPVAYAPSPVSVAVAPAPQAPATPEKEASSASNGHIAISSPMVGTFYRASSPSAPPFVDVGDRIAVGQTVCIIEAMKLMNDLPSEVTGKIVKVCVENGTTVEYGQTLFLLDPNN